MVSNSFLVILTVLVFSVRSANVSQPNFPTQLFCSAFCKPTKCNYFGPSNCTDCNTGTLLGWNFSSGVCSVTVAGIEYLDSSDDAGGMITIVSPTGRTSNCTNLSAYIGYNPYGDFKANDIVTIVLQGGTTTPHYQVDLYFNVILMDTDSGGSTKWQGGEKMMATLVGNPSNTSITKSFTMINSGGLVRSYNAYCGDTGKMDKLYQFQQQYAHNDSSTDIMFNITTDNSNGNALWNAMQFIMTIHTCNVACLSCSGPSNLYVCYSCDPSSGYMLNNYSCLTNCTTGFGYTDDPAMCVYCNTKCSSCYGMFDNCSACKTSGTTKSYLYQNLTLGYWTCVNPCPTSPAHFVNIPINTCQMCDPVCASCLNQTFCYSCIATYGWTAHFCYNPCPSTPTAMFMDGNNCTKCNLTCITCIDLYTCSECTLNGTYMAYLNGSSCMTNCPTGTYGDTNYGFGPNVCLGCMGECATCTGSPSPCQSCKTGWFLYNLTCGTSCPSGYFAFSPSNQCLDCSIYCVDVTINPYFQDSLCEILYVDMTFTKDLNYATFDMTTFQTVTIESTSSSEYTVNYQMLSASSYRIIIEPKGYIFIYNKTVKITTKTQPAVAETAADTTPFKPAAYSKSGTISWFLLKSPSMTEGEKSVIKNIASINTVMASATTAPFVAQVKKSGFFAMIFSGSQITSATVFINSIPSQNMYEAVRFWAIPVLYDCPAWQQNSKIPNNVMGHETSNLVKNQRLLFDMTTTYWRYQRTGHSSFFLYDVYIPILLISICWILALIAYCMRRNSDRTAFKSVQGKFFTVLHKLHEAVILYVTTAMMLQWMYFDAGSGERWFSLLICLLFTTYFVGYELYIYYDMIKYPEAFIGNARYEYYLNRYGSFLKNLRYEQYDMNEEWSPKHWFRPYNYHILSYYKKFCMIMSLPLFYELDHCQPSVLLILQCLQIARFLMTKPYCALWRNVYRFLLQLILLFFFLCIMINTYIIDKIVANDPDTLDYYTKVYYAVGWAGFAMVFAFNIGYLVLLFIDIVRGFKYTDRQLMEQARRIYYYGKIQVYERDHEQVPLGLMNRWVKLGNLNKRNIEELPDINMRVEYFKLVKHNDYFDVEVFKAVELFMNADLNFHRENNTLIGKKIKKKIKLSRETSKSIFGLISEVFSQFAKKDTEAIVVKTFVRVMQSRFQAGDRVPLLPHEMFQKIELQNYSGEKQHIKLKQKLKGFPLNPHDLESIG